MLIDDDLMRDLQRVAHAAADAARPATLDLFRSPWLVTDDKGRGTFDPVTQADRDAEAAIRAVLADLRPGDAVLGEECGATPGSTGLTWVIDPIDGTRGYMSGTPTWGTLISVADAQGPRFGLIDQPYIGERFTGGFGVALCDGPHGPRALRTRQTSGLAQATIMTTFPEVGRPVDRDAFHDLAARCRLTRYGMDCYAYALLALGQVDLVVEAGLNPYDIHAPICVVEAAGGIVTDWRGGPAHDGGRVLAAGNAQIHAAALKILAGHPDG